MKDGVYNGLSFTQIPFISTTKKAKHAASYALGAKGVSSDKKRTEGIVGRMFVYIFSLKNLKEQGAVDIQSLQNQGKVTIKARILNEGEITFTGSIPGENRVAQKDATAGQSTQDLADKAEKAAKAHAENGKLLEW